MKKTLINILKFGISISLGVLLIWVAVRKLTTDDISKIKTAVSDADYFWLFLVIVLAGMSNYLRAERWRLMFEPLGYKPGRLNTFFAVMIMYFGNLVFPRLGEVMRCTILNRYEKIPLEKAIGTMVVERIFDIVSLFAAGFIVVLIEYSILWDFFNQKLLTPVVGNIATISGIIKLIALPLVVILFFWLTGKLLNAYSHVNFIGRLSVMFTGLIEGLKSVRHLKRPWLFLIQTILIWVLYTAAVYVAYKSMEQTSHLSFSAATACMFFGGFAFIATQGGIGAYPIVIREVLMLYSVESIIGYTFGWVMWTVQTLSVLLGGAASFLFLPLLNRYNADR